MLHAAGDKAFCTVVRRVRNDIIGVAHRRQEVVADVAVAAVV